MQQEFAGLLRSIRLNTQWIDTEANVGLHILTHQLTSRGHQEILSSLAAIAAPPTMGTSSTSIHHIVPYVANPIFHGRSNQLGTLDRVLIPNIKSRLSIVSVLGPGGIGKSQLALQFTYNHLDDFTAIFWISAETNTKLAQGYEEIAVEMGLIQDPGDHSSLSLVRESTKKWLRTTGRLRACLCKRVLG